MNLTDKEMVAMEAALITTEDLRQIEEAGLSPDQVRAQIASLKKGVKPVKLNRPCTIGDGIIRLSEEEQEKMAALHDAAARKGRFMKFVPASGAASRMFIHWHQALTQGGFGETKRGKTFSGNLHKFAFFPDLKQAIASRGEDIEALLQGGEFHHILNYILTSRGLNYGRLPKALLKFHAYRDGRGRTPIEEHLVEAALHTADADQECRMHFTVSEEHLKAVSLFLKKIKKSYEEKLGVTLRTGLSSQSLSTCTVAWEGDNLCRDRTGRLVLRPGGHGALLKNLHDLDGDIIFIKNIDNVVPDRLKPEVVLYKKVLGGYFISLEEGIFRRLRSLSEEETTIADIREAMLFCREKLNVALPSAIEGRPLAQQHRFIISCLNRPLRVCGMVKNEGEPGGGPFWIDAEGEQSRQIVEYQQIDKDCEEQRAIWAAATHFNPVDLVCGVRNYQSQKFDLPLFADRAAVTLSEKIEQGKKITALEHPGLWNGAMAYWNTVFVDVPLATFNPVKTIEDLLRPQHLPES
jgi:hypothetical protein